MLVAEDSAVMRRSIGITFAHSDYKLSYSESGTDAISKAKELQPDIIIADANIVGQNGYDLCRAIKTDPMLSGTRVLLLSGAQNPYDENKGKAAGVDGYMIKPFETQALMKKVQELVDQKSSGISQVTQAFAREPEPSPASTISISSPYTAQTPPASKGISNEPFLDMDFSHASLPSSDLDLSPDTMSGFPLLTDTTQPIPKEMKDHISSMTSKEVPQSEDDFWNFSSSNSDAEIPAPTAPEPTNQEWVSLEPAAPEEASASFDLELMGTAESANMDVAASAPAPDLSNVDFGFEVQPSENLAAEPSFSFPVGSTETSFVSQAIEMPIREAQISLSNEQIEAIVTKVFKQVIERIAWEVVPDMAENIIKDELARLLKK